ncbi:hypothetical protein CAC42_4752 [Sphaceloma murrayae]|uniref:Uncharacterized protein n=1 Tax=Sphaceloma murrayae TaxID=2082308 RepID=A0A2K1QNT4_9PEZI|nr:hypothetical protein CAC42_4752 [Sphaceloma murrayae]
MKKLKAEIVKEVGNEGWTKPKSAKNNIAVFRLSFTPGPRQVSTWRKSRPKKS